MKKELNHPPCIIKQLPLSVEIRFCDLSENVKILKESIPVYQEALVKSGCNHQLKYQKDETSNKARIHKWEIILFNSSCSKNVLTKSREIFSKYRRLFYWSKKKISYSCTYCCNLNNQLAFTSIKWSINNALPIKVIPNNNCTNKWHTTRQSKFGYLQKNFSKKRYRTYCKWFRRDQCKCTTELSNEFWGSKAKSRFWEFWCGKTNRV